MAGSNLPNDSGVLTNLREVCEFRMASQLELIDAHTHVGADAFDGASTDTTALVELMEKHTVSRSVLFPFPNCPEIVCPNLACDQANGPPIANSASTTELFLRCTACDTVFEVGSIPYYRENTALIEFTELDVRLIPFLAVDPRHPHSAEMVEALANKAAGVKIHTFVSQSPADALIGTAILDSVRKVGLPLLFHCGMQSVADPRRVVKLAHAYRDIPMIMAHCARLEASALDAVARLPNLYVDTSLAPEIPNWQMNRRSDRIAITCSNDTRLRNCEDAILFLLRRCGRASVVFATDYPFISDSQYAEQVAAVRRVDSKQLSSANLLQILAPHYR